MADLRVVDGVLGRVSSTRMWLTEKDSREQCSFSLSQFMSYRPRQQTTHQVTATVVFLIKV